MTSSLPNVYQRWWLQGCDNDWSQVFPTMIHLLVYYTCYKEAVCKEPSQESVKTKQKRRYMKVKWHFKPTILLALSLRNILALFTHLTAFNSLSNIWNPCMRFWAAPSVPLPTPYHMHAITWFRTLMRQVSLPAMCLAGFRHQVLTPNATSCHCTTNTFWSLKITVPQVSGIAGWVKSFHVYVSTRHQ